MAGCFTVRRVFVFSVLRPTTGRPLLLPEELIEEILSRLPVKSLLRFKTVSKKWYSLITKDHGFAKLHLNQSSVSKNLTFFQTGNYCTQFTDINTFESSRKINLPMFDSHVIGSANGLVCVAQCFKEFCLIWNPCTEFRKWIPIPTKNCNLKGFGYDEISEDYKIVGVWNSKVHVFSLKAKSWRSLGWEDRFSEKFPWLLVALNGAIHGIFDEKNIVAFGLAKEEFLFMEMPENYNTANPSFYTPICIYQGLLCVFDCKSPVMSIWVMKEYGVAKSWAKLFTVSDQESGVPMCMTPKGEVVYKHSDVYARRTRLVKHNVHGKMCDVGEFRVPFDLISPFIHSESLIWPEYLTPHNTIQEYAPASFV